MYQKSYQEAKEHSKNRRIFSQKILYIIGAPVLIFILTLFVFHLYRIDGPSMEKTLDNNDRVVIEKLGRTWAKLTGKQYIPKRYEVAAFKNPNTKGEKELIKRVIGLPGERVTIVNNDVRIFNNDNPDGILIDKTVPAEAIIDDVTAGYVDLVLGPEEVFVLGDNREASYDSRDFGPIPTDTIAGTMTMRVYPFNDISFY